MFSEVNFLLYMSNVTIPGVPVIQNVGNAIGCGLQTKLVNGTSFFYDMMAKTCLVHPRTPFAYSTGLIPQPGSKYYASRYVQSCAEVKLCSPDYAADGEYWLYPAIYNHRAVKMYCKGMNTPTPSEYLTLPSLNYFIFPHDIYIIGKVCTLKSSYNERAGQTNYSKIGIDITAMTIFENDSNFTSQEFGAVRKYGWVEACSGHTPPCSYRGYSALSVLNTGLIFSELNEWEAFGFTGGFSIVKRTNNEVQILGDGWCGGGKLKHPLKLEIDPLYKPPKNSAIEPVCV